MTIWPGRKQATESSRRRTHAESAKPGEGWTPAVPYRHPARAAYARTGYGTYAPAHPDHDIA